MIDYKHTNIRWTLRLIRASQLLLMALIVYCIWRFLHSLNPYLSGALIFTSTCAALVMFVLSALEKGLQLHKHYTWNFGIITALVALATPMLPLAAMSLRELLNKENRNNFMIYKTRYSDMKMTPVTKVLLLMIVSACFLGGGLFVQFSKKGAFFDVAFQKPRYHLPPKLSIKELYKWGGECNIEGKTECSIAVFLTILQRNPGDTKALANLAMAQSHFGQHAHAIKNFQKAISKDHETYDLYLMYGNSLQATGQTQPAILAYKKSLDLNPHMIDAAAKIALILVDQEKYQEALSFIEGYLKKNPQAKRRLRSVRQNLKAKVGEA